ncbi:MAG: Mut7-C RNAse domain-containing protein [Desulforhabdus sp.]|jgi:uncharacterized protein with PIN domain|nr:Mut7-C RNAse domain-containing protein [Desulforhabdus sp.]
MEEKAPAERRFVVDSMLGKMAKWLRVLGFDTRYEHLNGQGQLQAYRSEGYLVLTRNQRWCAQPGVMCVAANEPTEQLRELVSRLSVTPVEVHLLKRCIICNEPLNEVWREKVLGLVPDYVFETQTTFYECPRCRRVYWPGSHPERMLKRLQDVLGWVL